MLRKIKIDTESECSENFANLYEINIEDLESKLHWNTTSTPLFLNAFDSCHTYSQSYSGTPAPPLFF